MGKNKFKDRSEDASADEVAAPSEKKEEATQTLYSHGKVFKLPASEDVEEFLKKKYPKEYK